MFTALAIIFYLSGQSQSFIDGKGPYSTLVECEARAVQFKARIENHHSVIGVKSWCERVESV